ncbi:MAG: hypothetical protein ACRCX2_19400 [Paraclostridium sp.]
MIIRQLDSGVNMIEANRLRISSIKEVQCKDVEKVILNCLEQEDNIRIKTELETKLFFEKIDIGFINDIKKVYILNKTRVLATLTGCYIEKGTKGINFCWGHLLF